MLLLELTLLRLVLALLLLELTLLMLWLALMRLELTLVLLRWYSLVARNTLVLGPLWWHVLVLGLPLVLRGHRTAVVLLVRVLQLKIWVLLLELAQIVLGVHLLFIQALQAEENKWTAQLLSRSLRVQNSHKSRRSAQLFAVAAVPSIGPLQ